MIFLVGFLAAWNLKGNMTLTADNQVRFGSMTMAVPAALQSNPMFSMVTNMMGGATAAPAPGAAPTAARTGAPAFPPVPLVSSTAGSYNGNLPAGGQPATQDPFAAANRALR